MKLRQKARAVSVLWFLIASQSCVASVFQFAASPDAAGISAYVNEWGGEAVLEVVREGDLDQVATVQFATIGETASFVADYTHVDSDLVFQAGETSKFIHVPITADVRVEGDETFLVKLSSNAPQAVIGANAIARVAIVDDDPEFEFVTPSPLSIREDEGVAHVTVRRNPNAARIGSVHFQLVQGTAAPGTDYTDVSGILTFAPGETLASFDIPIINDKAHEPTERFTVKLFNTLPYHPVLAVEIIDNDVGPEVVGEVSATEDSKNLTAQILRGTVPLGQPFSVDYFTTDRTAVVGKDYLAVRGTVQFDAQEQWKTISIPLIDNWLADGNRSFDVILTNASSELRIGDNGRASCFIVDDEKTLPIDFRFSSEATGYPGYSGPIVPLSDGRVLAGGGSWLADGFGPVPLIRLLEDGTLDRSFHPDFQSGSGYELPTVRFVFPLPDGRILAAGGFTINGSRNLGRLLPDGAPDPTFQCNGVALGSRLVRLKDGTLLTGGEAGEFNAPTPWLSQIREDGTLLKNLTPALPKSGSLRAIAVQPDGGVLLGGTFDGGSIAVVRLKSDFSVDESLKIQIRFSFGEAWINEIALATDGKFYIAGRFDSVNGHPRASVARFSADGTLDEAFVTGLSPTGDVTSLTLLANGRVLLSGSSFVFQSEVIARKGCVLLDANGAPVSGFNPPSSWSWPGAYPAVADQRGRILTIGWLPPYRDISIVRLAEDGTQNKGIRIAAENLSYLPPTVETNRSITLMAERYGSVDTPASVRFSTLDGSALAGLDYVATNGIVQFAAGQRTNQFSISLLDDGLVDGTKSFKVALHDPLPEDMIPFREPVEVTIADNEKPASLDGGFVSPFAPFSSVFSIVPEPDGNILVAGGLTRTFQTYAFPQTLMRLNQDGSVITVFQTEATNDFVRAFVLQSDGRIVASGSFGSSTNWTTFARFYSDGSRDTTFDPPKCPTCWSDSFALQPDGRIVAIQGDGGLLRLESSGAPDFSFHVNTAGGRLSRVAGLRDGKLLITGAFTNVEEEPYPNIARLDQNGALDESFQPVQLQLKQWETSSLAAYELKDSKILITGAFRSVGGIQRIGIARLNTDGSLDATFDTGTTLWHLPQYGTGDLFGVNAVVEQPDGKLLVSAGSGGAAYGGYAKFIRLNPDGSIDPSFQVGTIDAAVPGDGGSQRAAIPIRAIASSSDGSLFVGGELSGINGRPTQAIARLRPNAQAQLQSIGFDSVEYAASEADSEAAIRLVRTGDLTAAAAVDYSMHGGTATEGVDFLPTSGRVEFAPMETSQSFTVRLRDNAFIEPDKTIFLTLSNPGGGALLDRSRATFRVVDDDQAGSFDGSLTRELLALDPGNQSSVTYAPQADGSPGFLLCVRDATAARYDTYDWFRVTSAGILDSSFSVPKGRYAQLIGLPTGKFLGITTSNLVRLNADGSLDSSFAYRAGQVTYANWFAVLADGSILMRGAQPDGINQTKVVTIRLKEDGVRDESFAWPFNSLSSLNAVVQDGAGRIYVGGYFPNIPQAATRRLLRLRANGEIDPDFNPMLTGDSWVSALALTHEDRLLVAGSIQSARLTNRIPLARFWPSGETDFSWQPPAIIFQVFGRGSAIQSLCVDELGRVLISGDFAIINSVPRSGIARLNSDGTLDPAFDPGFGVWSQYGNYGRRVGEIGAITQQPDGQILIFGGFNYVNGFPVRQAARLNGDGAHRFSGFGISPNGSVTLTTIGRADRPQVIEASEDLRGWTPILTNSPSARSTISDPDANRKTRRFYRARRQ